MPAIDGATRPDLVFVLSQTLARVPDWIRQDLPSKDPATRARAEETLAAIIAAAVTDMAAAPSRAA